MTAPQPSRPTTGEASALFDAVNTEHGVIYGYGLVSAHSTPDENALVAAAMAEHRARRETAIAMLAARSVTAAPPAAGYRLPAPVHDATDAANLAIQMEQDAAVAWRAALEQATTADLRTFAVTAMSEAAVTAAKWRRIADAWPVTVAFPGGSE